MLNFSVNTNTGAFIALQNLSATNRSLSETQTRINTGLEVSSAKDNSAVYAIAQNLRGDVAGVSAIQTSLDRAKSSLDVAVSAGESISDLLIRAREIAVAATDNGLDENSRIALNQDFQAITSQIESVVAQAEFNGTNLLKASPDDISAITSVKQDSTVDRISVAGVQLTADSAAATLTVAAGNVAVAAGATLQDVVTSGGGAIGAVLDTLDGTTGVTVNDDGTLTVDFATFNSSASGVVTITAGGVSFATAAGAVAASQTTGTAVLNFDDLTSAAGGNFAQTGATTSVSDIDLTTTSDRYRALAVVDNFQNTVNSTLAKFGSAARQIEIQLSFAARLSDVIETGIGNLVDADLARESARLQSLQVKQQLGLQALSIANQAPSAITSLFGN